MRTQVTNSIGTTFIFVNFGLNDYTQEHTAIKIGVQSLTLLHWMLTLVGIDLELPIMEDHEG